MLRAEGKSTQSLKPSKSNANLHWHVQSVPLSGLLPVAVWVPHSFFVAKSTRAGKAFPRLSAMCRYKTGFKNK